MDRQGRESGSMDLKEPYSKTISTLRGAIRVEACLQGSDLLVRSFGGDRPHIGAVAIAIPHPSHADPHKISSTVSVYTVTGHKDDQIAIPLAKEIAGLCNRIVVALVGIHFENLTAAELADIVPSLAPIGQDVARYFGALHRLG